MIKRKKYLCKKSIFNKLIHWKVTDPKLYWQILNNLRFEDDTRNINWEQVTQHFQSQGKPGNINVDFTSRVKEYIENYKNTLVYNELADKLFCVK